MWAPLASRAFQRGVADSDQGRSQTIGTMLGMAFEETILGQDRQNGVAGGEIDLQMLDQLRKREGLGRARRDLHPVLSWKTQVVSVRSVATEQVLELLAGNPPPLPQGSVEGHERSTKCVLQLMNLLCKA